jgi:hypothetical protein
MGWSGQERIIIWNVSRNNFTWCSHDMLTIVDKNNPVTHKFLIIIKGTCTMCIRSSLLKSVSDLTCLLEIMMMY